MRGGTAGTGVSCAPEPVCNALRWFPACDDDCGDKLAVAVIGRVPGCAGSTVVPLREPGVDWIRDGLGHKIHKQIYIFTAQCLPSATDANK